MSLLATTTIATPYRRSHPEFSNWFLCFVLLLAIFGQPNGFFLYIPAYQLITAASIFLFGLYTLFKLLTIKSWRVPRINLWFPLICFFVFATISLTYAQNVLIGSRILFSMIFKVVIFAEIIINIRSTNDARVFLKFLAYMGTAFSIQALLLVLGVAIFKLQPTGAFNQVNIPGLPTYDFKLVSYGLLGFAKVYQTVAGMLIPRAQGMFTEPGWFANFLEISIFSTLGYTVFRRPSAKRTTNIMLTIQFLALFLSFSTAGWFAMGTGLFFYVLFLAPRQRRRAFRFLFFLIPFVGLTVVINYAFSPEYINQLYKIIWTEKFHVTWEGLTSANQRLESLRIAVELFTRRPVFGWGVSQMQVVSYASANNAFFTVAAELGIIGLFIYTMMIGTLVRTMYVNIRTARIARSPLFAQLSAASTGCVIALITHSMFVETNWNFFYWIGIAFLYVIHQVCRSQLTLQVNRSKNYHD